LSADEAARVEAHVEECAECAAMVAEARGFIAGSSRILTALDNAPRGVIPAIAPRKRFNPLVWRVAATVLVVAAGTLVVVRNSDKAPVSGPGRHEAADMVTIPEPAPPITIPGNAPRGTELGSSQLSAPSSEQRTANTAPRASSSRATPLSGKPTASTAQPSAPQRKQTLSVQGAVAGAVADAVITENAASSQVVAAAPTPQTFGAIRLRGATSVGVASEPLLKVVGRPRQIGARVTLYEVASGDTVTLTEVSNAQLSAVVTTGIVTAAPQEGRSAAKSAAVSPAQRADAAAANAPESQRAAPPAEARRRTPSAPAPVTAVEVVNGMTTITWPDATTGNVLKLSGRIPEARLREVKIRIERERAAAAAKQIP